MSANTLGRYQIVREIARSNDIVYEAVDPTLNRRVALKEMAVPPNLNPGEQEDRRNRFRREAEAAGRLSHPNIVSIFDYGTDRDRCYIAMEFLEGQTLGDVMRLRGALPVEETTEIILQLLNALAYAHSQRVVHRDIKPDNVQILPGGHIKLTDFGIARLMDEPSITADGQVFGTPSYMSPEQVAGKQVDARSDIFSCSVLMYEMLTGRKPFAGDSVVTITYNIMNLEPTPAPGVPPYLSAIIRKAMRKEPAERYQTAEEMMEDVRNRNAPAGYAHAYSYSQPPDPGQVMVPPNTGYPPPPQPPGPPAPTSAPDPFLKAPLPPAPPPPPREPILSPETRNFLGVLFLVIGLTGMLLFTIWAVSKAYQSFESTRTESNAVEYYNQAMALFNRGDYRGAINQFENSIRVSPHSETGRLARSGLAHCYVMMGTEALERHEAHVALSYAEQALKVTQSAAAHVLAGQAYSRMGRMDKAIEGWKAAAKSDPASPEAKIARESMAFFYYNQGAQAWNNGLREEAIRSWAKAVREAPGTEAAIKAQQRLDEIQGVRPPG